MNNKKDMNSFAEPGEPADQKFTRKTIEDIRAQADAMVTFHQRRAETAAVSSPNLKAVTRRVASVAILMLCISMAIYLIV